MVKYNILCLFVFILILISNGYSAYFTDTTNDDWNAGVSRVNVSVVGTGQVANLTSSSGDTTGYFESQVFDANSDVNWQSIAWQLPVAYNEEIANYDEVNKKGVNTSGLIFLMHFNNDSAYGENNTFFKDLSGYNVDGVCSGSNCPVYDYSDKKLGDAALDFDGVQDYINMGDWDNFTRKGQSYSFWFKADSLKTHQLLNKVYAEFFNDQGLSMRYDNTGRFTIFVNNLMDSCASGVDVANYYSVGEWVHTVAVLKSDNTIKIYRNGVDQSFECGGTFTGITSNNVDFTIGWRSTPGAYSQGVMDEVSIWDRELSLQEARQLYQMGADRLDMSVRSCDDNICNGEVFESISNEGSFGRNVSLGLSDNRYFQYKIEYERALDLHDIILNDVSVVYGNDSVVPVVSSNQRNSFPAYNMLSVFLSVLLVFSFLIFN